LKRWKRGLGSGLIALMMLNLVGCAAKTCVGPMGSDCKVWRARTPEEMEYRSWRSGIEVTIITKKGAEYHGLLREWSLENQTIHWVNLTDDEGAHGEFGVSEEVLMARWEHIAEVRVTNPRGHRAGAFLVTAGFLTFVWAAYSLAKSLGGN